MLEDICKQVKLQEVRRRLIRNLSKGYKQRVGIAQALVGYPEVLILDEPTVGLDPKQIIEIRDLIRRLSKNHTIFLSSHIMQEIEAVCDKLIIINHGRIVAEDTSENLSRNVLQINRIEMRIKGQKNLILSLIQRIPGVKSAELLRVREEGTVDVAVEVEKDQDVREAIFQTCSENKMPILMMRTDELNLEDIFLQMTGEREGIKK
jgi:ABC-2 type transport system ATP-binding protein